MSEDRNLLQAQKVYGKLCCALDRRDMDFEKDHEDMMLRCYLISRGGLYLEVRISVDIDNKIILYICRADVTVPDDKRIDMALCVNEANHSLTDGFFDYDIAYGQVFLRLTRCYDECRLSDSFMTEPIYRAAGIIDEFLGIFKRLADGSADSAQLLKEITERKHHKWKASEEMLEAADNIYGMACSEFEKNGCVMSKLKSNRMIYLDFKGEETSVGIIVQVEADEQLISFVAPLSVHFKEEMRMDAAVAASAITFDLINGGFYCGLFNGMSYFKVVTSFTDSEISPKALLGLVELTKNVVRDFGPKLKKLNQGEIDISAFV